MKLTKSQLREMIKEEMNLTLKERTPDILTGPTRAAPVGTRPEDDDPLSGPTRAPPKDDDSLSGPTRAAPKDDDPLAGPTAAAPGGQGQKLGLIVKELEALINKIKKAI